MEPESKLNPRQKKFLAVYLANGGNASGAAREAGYANPNQEAYRLLRVPQIAAVIKEHLDQAAMSAEEVLARLADHARGDISDFIDIDVEEEVFGKGDASVTVKRPWALNLVKARERGLLHLVKKISYDKNGNPSLELYDAQAALALIGKHHKLFAERVEHSGSVNITGFEEWSDTELEEYARTGKRGLTTTPSAGEAGAAAPAS